MICGSRRAITSRDFPFPDIEPAPLPPSPAGVCRDERSKAVASDPAGSGRHYGLQFQRVFNRSAGPRIVEHAPHGLGRRRSNRAGKRLDKVRAVARSKCGAGVGPESSAPPPPPPSAGPRGGSAATLATWWRSSSRSAASQNQVGCRGSQTPTFITFPETMKEAIRNSRIEGKCRRRCTRIGTVSLQGRRSRRETAAMAHAPDAIAGRA